MTVPAGRKLIAMMTLSPGVDSRTTPTTPTRLTTTRAIPIIVLEAANRRRRNERIEDITLPFRNLSWGGAECSEIVIHN
jgi:hypothetical protein